MLQEYAIRTLLTATQICILLPSFLRVTGWLNSPSPKRQ
jgi:hypothetical protein